MDLPLPLTHPYAFGIQPAYRLVDDKVGADGATCGRLANRNENQKKSKKPNETKETLRSSKLGSLCQDRP